MKVSIVNSETGKEISVDVEYREVMKALAQLNKVKNYESKRID